MPGLAGREPSRTLTAELRGEVGGLQKGGREGEVYEASVDSGSLPT